MSTAGFSDILRLIEKKENVWIFCCELVQLVFCRRVINAGVVKVGEFREDRGTILGRCECENAGSTSWVEGRRGEATKGYILNGSKKGGECWLAGDVGRYRLAWAASKMAGQGNNGRESRRICNRYFKPLPKRPERPERPERPCFSSSDSNCDSRIARYGSGAF